MSKKRDEFMESKIKGLRQRSEELKGRNALEDLHTLSEEIHALMDKPQKPRFAQDLRNLSRDVSDIIMEVNRSIINEFRRKFQELKSQDALGDIIELSEDMADFVQKADTENFGQELRDLLREVLRFIKVEREAIEKRFGEFKDEIYQLMRFQPPPLPEALAYQGGWVREIYYCLSMHQNINKIKSLFTAEALEDFRNVEEERQWIRKKVFRTVESHLDTAEKLIKLSETRMEGYESRDAFIIPRYKDDLEHENFQRADKKLCFSLAPYGEDTVLLRVVPHHLCGFCYKEIPKENSRSKCPACRVVRYCSKECQKTHWEIHREDCKLLRLDL